MPDDHDTEVVHDEERSRYELRLHGRLVGVADYVVDADRDGPIVFTHTEIDESHRGRGLGDHLVRAALDDARATDRRVESTCWFVHQFVREHPEYSDLFERAGSRRLRP